MREAFEREQKAYREYHEKLDKLPVSAGQKERTQLQNTILNPALTDSAIAFNTIQHQAWTTFWAGTLKEELKSRKNSTLQTWVDAPEKLPADFSVFRELSKTWKKIKKEDATVSPKTQTKPEAPTKTSELTQIGAVLDGTGIPTELEFSGKKTNSPPEKRPQK